MFNGNDILLAGYAVFLILILIVNLLYFFQVFKYRLPGDASVTVLALHLALMILSVMIGTYLLLAI